MPLRRTRRAVFRFIASTIPSLVVSCSSQPASPRAAFLDEATATRPAERAAEDVGGQFSLTVYSTADPATFSPQDLLQEELDRSGGGPVAYAPGFGVVRETRKMKLRAGVNSLEFTDVASGIDPTTVAFNSLTAPDTTSVLEQNFEYDLTNAEKLLQKYLGHEVLLTLSPPNGSKTQPDSIAGKLLSTAGGSYILQSEGDVTPLAIIPAQYVSSIRLSNTKTTLVSKPALNWKIAAQKAGEHDVQVTYQTDGLTWRADYNLLLSADEKSGDLSAWVTLLNSSGLTYPDTQLKLVAGDVQRFVSPQRENRYPVTNTLFASNGTTGFKEKSFFEYHLYALGRSTTLPNNSTKQIELFPPKTGVPVEKVYVYYGLTPDQRTAAFANARDDRTFGTLSNKTVDIYVRLKNSEANHLGIPLPAGRLRMYKTDPADSSREFIGEDIIGHTPKDEEVMARVGTAFDIVGDRVQTDFHTEPNVIDESFEITLRNRKDTPVQVIIKENLYRWTNWEITQSSNKWQKKDFRTIHIPVEVPANGEKKVTYKVHYYW